jgi:uncharacterized protein YceK
MRTLSTWLLISLAATALLAGCGSSGSSSTGTSQSSSTATTGAAKTPAVAAAVASCKRGVEAIPTLPSATRTKIEAICEKAASGDRDATRKAAREVCEEIVKASPIPDGSAKQHAIDGCQAAEKQN